MSWCSLFSVNAVQVGTFMYCCDNKLLPRSSEHIFEQEPAKPTIDNFTVVSLVTWPWIGSEAERDLVLIQTSLLFTCKCKLVSINNSMIYI